MIEEIDNIQMPKMDLEKGEETTATIKFAKTIQNQMQNEEGERVEVECNKDGVGDGKIGKKSSEQHKFVVVCVMQFCDLHIFLMANACMQNVSAEIDCSMLLDKIGDKWLARVHTHTSHGTHTLEKSEHDTFCMIIILPNLCIKRKTMIKLLRKLCGKNKIIKYKYTPIHLHPSQNVIERKQANKRECVMRKQ